MSITGRSPSYKSDADPPLPAKVAWAIACAVLSVVVFGVWFIGSENPTTPAGYIGYLTQGALFGQAKFHGLQTGPASPGRTWLLDVTNVSVTPYTYTESFTEKEGSTVLAADNLSIGFNVHLVWKVRADHVKEVVEQYSTLNTKGGGDKDRKSVV